MFASQHVLSHQISLDIDLYCQHVFWLAGYLPPIFPQLALEADLGSDCHGSSNGLVGKYQAVLFIKEWLTYLYMCLLCSYAANFRSPLSHTNNYIFCCKMLKSSLLQQMAPDNLQAVCQPTRICRNLSTCLFATQVMMISAKVSSRLFMAGDGVKPSRCLAS